MRSAVFFDDARARLEPLTGLRPVFDVRLGPLSTLHRVTAALDLRVVALFVPPELEALTGERHDLPINRLPERADGPLLLVNGRCPMPPEQLASLRDGQALVEAASGDVVAALLAPDAARALLGGDDAGEERVELEESVLLSRPWHFRAVRDQAVEFDLDLLARDARRRDVPAGVTVLGDPSRVQIDPDAEVLPGAVLDAEGGRITIGAGAIVRPGAVIVGPCYVGPESRVVEHAVLRAHTCVGRCCRVGGEVAGVVFQGYANKVHEGFLGDSWVGEWVNLGAGTTNSNLLNTYAEVIARADPADPNERTGETFLGAMIGDHVKTAIGTRIMTGAVVHMGTMWAASRPVTGCVRSFAWATDDGERLYRLPKFLEVVQAVMARRNIEPTDAYIARIRALHASAAGA